MKPSERIAARVADSRKDVRDSVVKIFEEAIFAGVTHEFARRMEEPVAAEYSPVQNLQIAIHRLKDKL